MAVKIRINERTKNKISVFTKKCSKLRCEAKGFGDFNCILLSRLMLLDVYSATEIKPPLRVLQETAYYHLAK